MGKDFSYRDSSSVVTPKELLAESNSIGDYQSELNASLKPTTKKNYVF